MTGADVVDELTAAQQAAVAKLACIVERGGVALLCGPAGVGKTSVLARLARAAAVVTIGPAGGAEVERELAEQPGRPQARLVLVDDAHVAAAADLAAVVAGCRARQPAAAVVLAGQGRLLTVVAREPRLERAVAMRVVLQPFSSDESLAVVGRRFAREAGAVAATQWLPPVARTIHEIAGGIAADVVRLADLASVVAAARPGEPLTPADVEAIHRRLAPHAA